MYWHFQHEKNRGGIFLFVEKKQKLEAAEINFYTVRQKKSIYDSKVVKCGALTIRFIWFVVVPPNLITTPSNITVVEGTTAKFHCNATGNPIPKITWLKDGKTVGEGSTLSFTADRNNSGKYLCLADNGLSSTVNATAYLDVQCKYELKTFAWSFHMDLKRMKECIFSWTFCVSYRQVSM